MKMITGFVSFCLWDGYLSNYGSLGLHGIERLAGL